MAARTGMANLISRWRRMVDDSGTVTWSDDQAQQILDVTRADFWWDSMAPVPEQSGGSTVYTVYLLRRQNLEELSSGSVYWRVFDGSGTTIGTTSYSVDYLTGIITFTADQMGSARFLTGRAFDLYGAAADAWRERAASKASAYNFAADGGRFDRSQWFEHCLKMAEYYGSLAHGGMTVSLLVRSDVA